ncbi:hypothetical protein HY641_00530 [Candidatus Woesearchaeota archaeon]|nr:hypothetical protein [Candidatus Woesearchaeota archaeon]
MKPTTNQASATYSVATYGIIIVLIIAIAGGIWTVASPTGAAISPSAIAPSIADAQELSPAQITVYKSQSCGCCGGYIAYLKESGFTVNVIETRDIDAIKEQHHIPQDVWSCHTAMMGDYFIEGHVPIEAVRKLANERPQVDGIALSGMPAGSPGMGGVKRGSFGVVSLKGGVKSPFIEV